MMRMPILAALMLFATPAMAEPAIPLNEMISGAIDDYIRPSIAQFADDSTTLRDEVSALCATPSQEALGSAQDAFRTAAVSYARIEFLHLGPQTLGNRAERLLFWPDSKGIALRQVQTALAQKDETATSPETLLKKSVAMQGLGALEYVLFGTGNADLAGDGGDYRCRYGAAITSLVADLAATLNDEWQDESTAGPVSHMLDPQPDADDYRSSQEVLEKLAGTLINGTETIRDQRITPILSPTTKTPKPRSALFWRSNMTVPSLAANFAGLSEFFEATKFSDALAPSKKWIGSSVRYEFEVAADAATRITDPMEQAVKDPAQLAALRTLSNVTGTLDQLLGTNLAQTLGLSIGFSLLDGD